MESLPGRNRINKFAVFIHFSIFTYFLFYSGSPVFAQTSASTAGQSSMKSSAKTFGQSSLKSSAKTADQSSLKSSAKTAGQSTIQTSADTSAQTANSRTLNYYYTQAASNSPLLKELLNQQLSAGLDSLKIRKLNGPQINAGALAQYAPSFNHFGYDNAISNGGTYNATVNISQPILNHAFIKAQLRDVLVKKDSLGNTRKINFADLKRSLINQYIQTYTDQKQFFFQRDLLNLLLDQERIMKPLVRSGVYKQSDYLTFLVSRQSQEVTVAQQKMAVQNDLSTLNLLCGVSDTVFYVLADPGIVRGIPRDRHQNPLFIKYRLDSIRLSSLKQSLDAYYKPKLNWFADAGFESSTPAFYKYYGTSFGLNLTIPIYDGHLRKIGYKQLKLSEISRQNYRSFYEKQYDQQVESLEQQLNSAESLEASIKGQLHFSNLLIEVDRKLLNTGDLKITDYLLALNAYRTTQFNLSQQDLSRLVIINQLNYWTSDY